MKILRAIALSVAVALLAACTQDSTAPRRDVDRPNVLVFVTDDQRVGTFRVMPATRRWFLRRGTSFTHAFATTPECCPSRASILTGLLAHNHGVLTNEMGARLDQDAAMQRYLQEAGYHTAIAGKYLNYASGFRDRADTGRDPAHFDEWFTFLGGYNNPLFNVDGELRKFRGYSTEIVARRAVAMLHSFERRDDQPWFLYVAPFAPHPPSTPAPRFARTPVPPPTDTPATKEGDLADKSSWVIRAQRPRWRALRDRRRQLRSLRSVDELVSSLSTTLRDDGENRDTLAIFISDNGFVWGEHGLTRKGQPYTPSIAVPLFMSWPGRVDAGRRDRRLAANIDIAPTVLEAAGLQAPEVDGRSLLGSTGHRRLVLEHRGVPDTGVPPWASLRTESYQYIEFYGADGELSAREYYDLRADPWQLENLLGDGDRSNDPDVDRLARRLQEDLACRGRQCP